ncbi:MAG: hypothetical protein EP346_06210, partial [Bacteroidetes bacterium]
MTTVASKFLLSLLIVLACFSEQANAFESNTDSVNWYSSMTKFIAESEYHLNASEDACHVEFSLFNRSNGYHASLEDAGFTMELLEGETPISINLHQILVDGKPKYSNNLQGYNQIDKNEVTFWHKGFQVQYVNTNDGLRQNFILPENPGGNTLNIQLSVSGATPQLANANKVGLFRNGEEVLQYADLKVWDATGAALPGEMKVLNGRIELVVTGLESAIYPLVIDPLSSTP